MMPNQQWLDREAIRSLNRLKPRILPLVQQSRDAEGFERRLDEHFPRLFGLLHHLYGQRYDFFFHLEQILTTAAESFVQRSEALTVLDQEREASPLWFQSHEMLGGVAYVDLFAGDLQGMHDKLDYLQGLGLTYLHLMPLFKSPPDNSDGGYAVSDYRQVNPKLGTMADLAELASALRDEGISLVLDFVFNHTSNQHEWAQKALADEGEYRDYYYIFPDRTMPDAYERTLREIFPEQAPGNFTYQPQEDVWVWTSFYEFQWDLNYSNPAVFDAMLGELLFLANQGVEIFRLDAVAFIWKQLGTSSESLPEAHMIIQAYNALTRIVCPAVLFKSEAIVHPDEVASYIGWHEAPLSYNPTLMALLWEAIATRKVTLLQASMSRRFDIPANCAWVNYVRVHDDIGWTFADEDAAEVGINGYDHRRFLNAFYTGVFDGSFSVGLPFGYNEQTGDMRISGTAASLAGLEQALQLNDELYAEMAIRRLLLLHSIIFSVGGIPLLYLGDEIATLNNYSFRNDPNQEDDSRWVHRPEYDWQRWQQRNQPETVVGDLYHGLKRMITVRQATPALGRGVTTFFSTQNEHVLGYIRAGRVLVLANFNEAVQMVEYEALQHFIPSGRGAHELLSDQVYHLGSQVRLEPYQVLWIHFES